MKNKSLSPVGIAAAATFFASTVDTTGIKIKDVLESSEVTKDTLKKFRAAELVREYSFDCINRGFLQALEKKKVENSENYDLWAVYEAALKVQNLNKLQNPQREQVSDMEVEELLKKHKINRTALAMLPILGISIYILKKQGGNIIAYMILNGEWGKVDVLNEAICQKYEKLRMEIGIYIGGQRILQVFPDAPISLVGNVFSVDEYNYYAEELMKSIEQWVYKLHLIEKYGDMPLL